MTINLPEDLERYLRAGVERGRFTSVDQAVALAVGMLEQRDSASPGAGPLPSASRPIWEVAREITADIPPEEWAKIPADSSEQHDHYIYGTPKRPAIS